MGFLSGSALVILGGMTALYFSPRSIKRWFIFSMFDRMDKTTPAPRSYAKQVLPHSDLEQLYNNLWIVRGTLPKGGPSLPRAMVIYKLPGTSQLLVHSVICVREDTVKQIEALGTVAYILVPNRGHRLNANAWAQRYPEAKVICPSFARDKIELRVPVDHNCEELMEEYPQEKLPGVSYMRIADERLELVYILKLEGAKDPEATAFLSNDIFFNIDPKTAAFVTRLIGSASGFGMTKLGILLADDLPSLKKWIATLPDAAAKMKLDCILVGHGDPVIGASNVIASLRIAANRLK